MYFNVCYIVYALTTLALNYKVFLKCQYIKTALIFILKKCKPDDILMFD